MLRRHGYKLTPVCLALAVIPISGLANQPKVTRLEPVTISATRTEQNVHDVSASVSVQTEQDIDRKNINNIHDLVRYEPGVSVGGSQSRFGYSGFTIRGIGGNRVLTQVDGVAIANNFSFGPFLSAQRDYVDLDTIKRVEIIKGPASSLYGSDAIAGVVSFVSKDAADYLGNGNDAFFRLKTGYDGSDYSWLRSGTIASRYEQFDFLLQASKHTGHNAQSNGQHGGVSNQRARTNPQDKQRDSILTKLGWDISEQQRLQLTYETSNNQINSNLLTSTPSAKEIQEAIQNSGPRGVNMTTSQKAKDDSSRQRVSLLHKLDLNLAFADHIETQLSYQESKTKQKTLEDYLSYSPITASQNWSIRHKDSRYQERMIQINSMLQKHFEVGQSEHLITYGFEYKRIKNRDIRKGYSTYLATQISTWDKPESDFPDPTTTQYAVFVQDQITYGNWVFLPGLRYDHYKMAPKVTQRYKNTNAQDYNPNNYTDSRVSPKLGVTYQINDNYSVYGQYTQGFRAPQAVEIFGEFENTIRRYRALANTNLKAETSQSYEVGFRGKFESGSFGLATFYNKYKNFIDQDMRPSTKPGFLFEFQNVNRDDVIIQGIEAQGEYDLAYVGLPQSWSILGTLAYAHGQDKGSHKPINSIEPLKGVFTLRYLDAQSGRFGSDLSWTLVAHKNRINKEELANPITRAGYGILDLTGWWQVTENFSVNAGVYNLTNKRYWNWNDVREATGNTPTQTSQLNKAFYSQTGRYGAINFILEI